MFVLLLVLLLTLDIGYGLQCTTGCVVWGLRFGQPFRIPDGQCQQRISASVCSVELDLTYNSQTYSAVFGSAVVSSDFIYITSGPYLSYRISYRCSKGDDCALSYIQNRITEMVGRAYDATHIYGQLLPLIEDPPRVGSLQCYNMQNDIITCPSNQACAMEYDQRAKKFKSRGCDTFDHGRVSVYDGESYSSLEVECAYNLCNTDATLGQIKTVLANSGLTDSNARRIAAGTREMASSLLMTFAMISVIVSYF